MTRKLLSILFATSGLLAGCKDKDVDPSQVSVSSAEEWFDHSGDVDVKMDVATLRAIESGLSTPALGSRVSFAQGATRPALVDHGCNDNDYSCLELILNNARAPHPELMKQWIDKMVAKPVKASGGDPTEAARNIAWADTVAAESDFQVAAQYYGKALAQTPTDLDLSLKLVKAHLQSGEKRFALGVAERAVHANPSTENAWLLLAAVFAVNNNPVRAVDALLVTHLLASDQAKMAAEIERNADDEASPLRSAATEALALLAKKIPTDSYESMCQPSLPAVLKTCEGATISGVARYEHGNGVSSPVQLSDGRAIYGIVSPTKLEARQGQLIRFTALIGAKPGEFTQGRFELLPFAGSAREKLAWDALQLVRICASANREFVPSLFDPYEKMKTVKQVRIDPANPSNGSVVLATARERVGYVYRCAIRGDKLAALQAREEGDQVEWEPMAKLVSRRAEAAMVAEKAQQVQEKARAEAESKDPVFIRSGQLLLAANRGVGQVMAHNHPVYEQNQRRIEELQQEMNTAMENGSTERKIGKVLKFAKEVQWLCDVADAPCTDLRQQLSTFSISNAD